MRLTLFLVVLLASALAVANPYSVTDRGLIAVPHPDGGVYLSWRLFKEDSLSVAFDIYRVTASGTRKLNQEIVTQTTDFWDMEGKIQSGDDWYVEEVTTSKRSRLAIKSRRADGQYLEFPTGQKTHGRNFATGDLLGRGQLDYVLRHSGTTVDPFYSIWRSTNSTYKLTAFDRDGHELWVYDMGWAIEEGMWYSPFVVYDLDGDGKAEVIVKAGDSSMDKAKMRDVSGRVMFGPEYLRVLSGEDGNTVLAEAAWPSRSGFMTAAGRAKDVESGKYEEYNQWSRNFIAIAYLDGVHPHIVVSRGTYGKHKTSAYRYRNGSLQQVWTWENQNPAEGGEPNQWGQGAHSLQANDVDGDGRDEVIIGALVLNDDGTPLYTGMHNHKEHLDHVYVGDIDPSRPGKEFYYGAEWGHKRGGIGLRDAATGAELWASDWPTDHIHSEGLCADLVAGSPGIECYSGESDESAQWLFAADGGILSTEKLRSLSPLAVWWDSDLQKELLEGRVEVDGDVQLRLSNMPARDLAFELKAPEDADKDELHHMRVIAVLDLLGDWREEILVVDRHRLLVYTTAIAADRRIPWLMSDRTYRLGVTSGSVGYYQQPMLDMDLASAPQYKRPGPFTPVRRPAETAQSTSVTDGRTPSPALATVVRSPVSTPAPAPVAEEFVASPAPEDVVTQPDDVPALAEVPRTTAGTDSVAPARAAKSSGAVDLLWLLLGAGILLLGGRRSFSR